MLVTDRLVLREFIESDWQAVHAVPGYGFRELGLHRVYATCRPVNVACSRVMEKVGMQQEGHLRQHRWMKGAWHDSLLYAILEDEWQGLTEQDG